ncbi:MAG: hypothetical protein L0154_22750 [Chloroflexi bacterium]|nr:hypothetical protein [Chloroflexota bacterium]
MTIYGVERKYNYGTFRFEVAYDSGNEASLDQRDIYWSEPLGESWWVRSFYFDDVNDHHMRNFCKRFAEDESYRKTCLEQKTDWAIRDQLFRRNIGPEHWQDSLVKRAFNGDVPGVYNFFKKHWKTIVELEEYQRIQQIDTTFQPSRYELDPRIREAVECFNQIPGVKTMFSCQGVTGTIIYENLDILVDSPHARFAYIRFETLPEAIESALQTYAPSIAQYKPLWKILESTGDNLQFRQTALDLARSLQHPV